MLISKRSTLDLSGNFHLLGFLKKKKIKLSKNLTESYLQSLRFISRVEGEEPLLAYISKVRLLTQFVRVLERNNQTKEVARICWKTYKLHFLQQYQEYYRLVIRFGTVSSLKLQKFEHAFHYFKQFVKQNPSSPGIACIFATIIYQIQDQDIYRTFLSKLGCRYFPLLTVSIGRTSRTRPSSSCAATATSSTPTTTSPF